MEKYHASAREFRPKTFNEVVGQEAIVTILKNAIRKNTVSHGYLFSGTRGIGKTTLARILAKALNCKTPTDDLEPCNQCPSCNEISACNSLDVIEIDGASNRGIDDIRKINETVFYIPSSGKYRIYIIDEVHMLTKEAFNALLKTLEAPPENVKFFFATTEVHKVPATILSRIQRLELKSPSLSLIVEHLIEISTKLKREASKEALTLLAKLADGSLRDALSLLDQLLCYTDLPIDEKIIEEVFRLIPSELFEQFDQAIFSQNSSAALDLVDQVVKMGMDLSDFLEKLIDHFRLHLHEAVKTLTEDTKTPLFLEKQLIYIIDLLIQGQILLQKSPSKRAITEILIIKILESKYLDSLPNLAKRLFLLEKNLREQKPNPAPTPITAASSSTIPTPATPSPAESDSKPDKTPPAPNNSSQNHPSHNDNLMRFSEVELEGIIHKN